MRDILFIVLGFAIGFPLPYLIAFGVNHTLTTGAIRRRKLS